MNFAKWLGGVLLVAASAAHAAPVLVTTPGGLGATDSVNWTQLGPDGATIPTSFTATSTDGVTVTGNLTVTTGCVAVVGTGANCFWAAGTGFNPGDSVIWTEDDQGAGSGPLSLGLSSDVLGAGFWFQSNSLGAFTALIQAFNSANVLIGSFTEASASGAGIFIGVRDTVADIRRISVTLSGCTSGCDFAVNTLLLNEQRSTTVPEPGTLALMALGLGAAVLRRRRAVRQS